MYMKNLHKHIKSFILISIFIIGSCTDDFESINTDESKLTKSQLSEPEIAQMFTSAENKAMSFGIHWKYQLAKNLFADLYGQYFATSKLTFASDRYFMNQGWLDICWRSFYQEPVREIIPILELTKDNEKAHAVAQIWKVYTFIPITDQWGPVPYSQIGNGLPNVPYDSQEDIYSDFFTSLDNAVEVLSNYTDEKVFASGDMIYEGDVPSWIRFANTLKLRLALRISDVDYELARTYAEEAVESGVIENLEEHAIFPVNDFFPNELNRINAWGGEFRMSAAMESVLKGFDDPRLPEYFSPAESTGNYDGLTNGLTSAQMNEADAFSLSLLGPRFDPPNQNVNNYTVLSAAESWFLRAEGALNGWNMGDDAINLYNKGIEISLKEWGISDPTVIDTYINSANTPVAPDDYAQHNAISDIPVQFAVSNPEIQLEQIITQKWIALFPNGFEAWAEFRRTGFPQLYNVLNSDNSDLPTSEFIKRLIYPDVESVQNGDELEKGIELLNGPDKASTRVWWDVD